MPEDIPQPQVTLSNKTSWKKIGLTVIIILVVTGLIAGAYWFFIMNKESDTSDLTGPVPNPQVSTSTPSATPTATKDETTKLKTFKDEELGITFMYPNDWVIKLPNTNPTCGEDVVSLAPNKKYLGTCGSENFPMVFIKPPLDSRIGCDELQDPEKVVIDGMEANKCESISEGPTNQDPGLAPKGTKRINYYFPDTKFAIWYFQYPDWPDHEKELEQIVSTFKFLE